MFNVQRSTLGLSILTAVACCLLPVPSQDDCYGWGYTGHKMVTDRAVRLLPTEVQDFYWENRDVLIELCVQPDVRKEVDRTEAPKHYIDLEQYPADVPTTCDKAIERFGMKKLSQSGWAPWNTQRVYAQLVDALRRKDYPAILRLSGDLSHYVADMHVPLHTTENFDGQLTRDTGIHARWESRLLELFPEVFPFDPRPAEWIHDIPSKIWAIVLASSTEVNGVIHADRQNAYDDRDADGYSIVRARQTHAPLAARRMNEAAQAVASFWYTAWVESGRPALARVDFSALVNPVPPPSGAAVFYNGQFTSDIPMSWPLPVREAVRRIGDYLRLETKTRLAKVSWSVVSGELRIRVDVLETVGGVNQGESEKILKRLIAGTQIKFRVEE